MFEARLDLSRDLSRSVVIFAIAQLFCVAIQYLLVFVGSNLGTIGSVVATLACAMVTAYLFVKQHGRRPTQVERKTLAWLSVLVIWAIVLVASSLQWMLSSDAAMHGRVAEAFARVPVYVLLMAVAFSGAIYFGLFYWIYGWFRR